MTATQIRSVPVQPQVQEHQEEEPNVLLRMLDDAQAELKAARQERVQTPVPTKVAPNPSPKPYSHD